jgi:hypothetical protein
MKPVRVSIINRSKILENGDIIPVVAALQAQVSKHLAPNWRIDAALEFVPSSKEPPGDSWRLEVWDDTDYPPDSGYHNVGSDGVPYGKVFVNTARGYKQNWTITASHELLEMLVNPYANLSAYVPFDANTGTFYSLEICDPVSPDENGYKIDGINVSDFVFPEWFSPFIAEPPGGQTKQVDYCKRLTGPAPTIVPATTISVFGWRDLRSPAAAGERSTGKDTATLFSRRNFSRS